MFIQLARTIGYLTVLGLTSLTTLAAEPIKIGSVLSVTGPAAFLGEPNLKTLKLYVDKINAEGGVLGRTLQLVHYDDGGDANKANGFGKRLIEEDKVDIIVGGSTTGSTMAMVPLVEKAGVPFVSLAGAVVIVEPVKKWVFKTPHTDRMAAERIFESMKKRGIAKVGLLSETSGFGQSGRKESQGVAKKYGITLVADETYAPKDTDMTAQLAKIKSAPGLQGVLIFGLGQGAAIATKNFAQLGINVPLYQSHGVASKEYIKLCGKAAEGVRLPAASFLIARSLPPGDPEKPVALAYEKAYRDRFKEEVSAYGGNAYDGIMLAVDAIKRAGSTDKEKVRAALEQTKGFAGINGVFNMSPANHLGLSLTSLRMLEVKNGDFVLAQ